MTGLVQRATQQLVWLVQMNVYSRYHPTRELYSPGALEKAIAFYVINTRASEEIQNQ